MTKPIVHFDAVCPPALEVGRSAYIYVFDHPRLGNTDVTTSTVQKINEDGSFETLNTIYQPLY